MKNIKRTLITGLTVLALTVSSGTAFVSSAATAIPPLRYSLTSSGYIVNGIITGSTLNTLDSTTLDKKVVRYVATFSNGKTYQSTGFIIGDHTIATCAHGLYIGGEYPTKVQIYFGYSKGSYTASTTVNYSSTSKNIQVHSNYITSASTGTDLGVITTTMDLSTYGKFSLDTSYNPNINNSYTVKGYPGVNVVGDSTDYIGYQCYSTGTYSSSTSSYIQYLASTLNGMSGGPVIYNNKVVAVHSQDRTSTTDPFNAGSRNMSWFSDKIS